MKKTFFNKLQSINFGELATLNTEINENKTKKLEITKEIIDMVQKNLTKKESAYLKENNTLLEVIKLDSLNIHCENISIKLYQRDNKIEMFVTKSIHEGYNNYTHYRYKKVI